MLFIAIWVVEMFALKQKSELKYIGNEIQTKHWWNRSAQILDLSKSANTQFKKNTFTNKSAAKAGYWNTSVSKKVLKTENILNVVQRDGGFQVVGGTVLVLCKNVLKRLSEVNLGLLQTQLMKSTAYLKTLSNN